LTAERLARFDIGTLLLDVDNTLAVHGHPVPREGVKEWIADMKQAGIKLVIISNAYDKRIKPFAALLGLPYTALSLKPLPFALIKQRRRLNVFKQNVMMVGDQLFTDIMAAKLAGVRTALVSPVGANDIKFTALRRGLERKMVARYKRDGGFLYE